MVYVAGDVTPAFAVDGPLVIELKKVLATASVGFFFANNFACVFDHPLFFSECSISEKSKPCSTSFYFNSTIIF